MSTKATMLSWRASQALRFRPRPQRATLAAGGGAEEKTLDRGDVEIRQIAAAEGAVRGTAAWDGMHFFHFAGWRKDIDHGPGSTEFPAGGGDDVSFGIETHSVDTAMFAEIVQDFAGAERAVVFDRVSAQLALLLLFAAALRNIEDAVIERKQQAVGTSGIEGYSLDRPGSSRLWIQTVNGIVRQLFM